MQTRKILFFVILAGLLMIAGCAEIRKLTYPPEITYIDQSKLDGAMDRMALAMHRIDKLVEADEPGDRTRRQIIEQLDLIDQISSELSGGKTVTNHLLLDEHMSQFSADVARARLMASASPPNYYYAGRLSGSCSGCHQFR